MNAQALLLWLLGGLVASMLFFAVVVTPTVFRALPTEQAGTLLRRLFPVYYLWGLAGALLATTTSLIAGGSTAAPIACALVALLFVYARIHLLPAIGRARDERQQGSSEAEFRFRRLHGLSVGINLLQLVLLIAATVAATGV